MDSPSTLSQISKAALDLKAQELVQIDLEGKSSLADFILICHGTSTAHAKGIADKISLNLKQVGILPLGIEGYESGDWILMDFNSVIIHIFLEETRALYDLEQLYHNFNIQRLE
jgi:ribosome-associated protein